MQNADVATFGAFGSFAMLLLVDFGGPMRERLQAQAGWRLWVPSSSASGTLASRSAWIAAVVMAVIGFAVLFVGVVSSVLAGASTALLLSLILPITVKAPNSAIPDRLAGWGLAAGASLIAIAVLWPAPTRYPLAGTGRCRVPSAGFPAPQAHGATCCRSRMRRPRPSVEAAFQAAEDALTGLQKAFLATPYRPTGLTTPTRTVVRLVDELNWLRIVLRSGHDVDAAVVNRASCKVKRSAAAVLEQAAAVLDDTSPAARPR